MDFPLLRRDGRDPLTRQGGTATPVSPRKPRYHVPLIVGIVAGVIAAILAAKIGWIR